jgi:hypothetical protein
VFVVVCLLFGLQFVYVAGSLQQQIIAWLACVCVL